MNRSKPGSPTISTTSPTSVWCRCWMTTKVLVDVPFPRELALQRLKHVGDEHPGTPVLPMPKPLTREAFVAALRRAKDAIQ